MRLCDSLLNWRPDDVDRNRCLSGPFRSTDPHRCLRCGGWLDHGRLLEVSQLKLLAGDASSILSRIGDDYPWVVDLAHNPTRRPQNGRSGVVGNPTANAAADPARARIRAYTLIVGRLVEDAVRSLRHADDACGEALMAAEPPGPREHVKAAFHDSSPRAVGRPDLDEAYEAQDRRRARGEAL
jgi:hypothetical protein